MTQTEGHWLDEAAALLDARIGHRVLDRHRPELARTLRQIAAARGHEHPEQLLAHLRGASLDDPAMRDLLSRVTVNESYFFRDEATMATLRRRVLPRLIESRSSTRLLRVWSAGCSRGEELYSLAILLEKHLPDPASWTINLVGSDVDQNALDVARSGLFADWSLRTLTPVEKERHFQREGRKWRLQTRYRRGVTFVQQSVTTDAAPAPHEFDLLFFRNVSIYLSAARTREAFERLRAAMAPGAFLVLGPSDPPPPFPWPTEIAPGTLLSRRPEGHERPEQPAGPEQGLASVIPLPRRAPDIFSFLSDPRPAPAESLPPDLHRRRPADPSSPSSLADPRPASAEPPLPPDLYRRRPADPSPPSPTGLSDDRRSLDEVRRLADRGENEDALRGLTDHLRAFPLDAAAHLLGGILHFERCDLAGAEAYLRKAIYLEESCASAHLHLGMVLEQQGDLAGARQSLGNALVLAASEGSPRCSPELTLAEVARIAGSQLSRFAERGRPT
ncbi:MAG: tetratricopeptide repeat protein [Deltaproteobacteria bacterium]|nr:tetratricopeptide repeat protein [Deltaproteobacteria bacterium]